MKKKVIIIGTTIIALIISPFLFSMRNNTLISLRYNDELRILDVTAGNSITYLTSVVPEQNSDTLELQVYQKIMYFVLRKSEKNGNTFIICA